MITTLDPNTALVVIDLQKGLAGYPTVHPIAEVVARNAKLAAAFRAKQRPVVLVNAAGIPPGRTEGPRREFKPTPELVELMAELDRQPSDLTVTKYTQGAFHGTPLDMFLRRRGVTQIVLTGIATGSGVESTAREAYAHGYNVTLVTDAMTDLSQAAHDHAIGYVFPKLGERGTTDEVIALL
jgi:nicotinamidase-related amidase